MYHKVSIYCKYIQYLQYINLYKCVIRSHLVVVRVSPTQFLERITNNCVIITVACFGFFHVFPTLTLAFWPKCIMQAFVMVVTFH